VAFLAGAAGRAHPARNSSGVGVDDAAAITFANALRSVTEQRERAAHFDGCALAFLQTEHLEDNFLRKLGFTFNERFELGGELTRTRANARWRTGFDGFGSPGAARTAFDRGLTGGGHLNGGRDDVCGASNGTTQRTSAERTTSQRTPSAMHRTIHGPIQGPAQDISGTAFRADWERFNELGEDDFRLATGVCVRLLVEENAFGETDESVVIHGHAVS